MTTAYYSTIFDMPAATVWAAIRDFGNYRLWVDGVDESRIEDNRPGDAVGAVRFVRMGETVVRQRLLAHSDRERFYTYEFLEPYRFPMRDYAATIRVTSVTAGDRAFVEWWATFDTAEDAEHWRGFFAQSFGGWLDSLRRHLSGGNFW